ncbi:hypothetical protein EDC01DRAFT_680882 [Geopyxis carbonaria]|nr:hypothetical protein EDC01DRAFT_680882 [Geopyxis carbonaria]
MQELSLSTGVLLIGSPLLIGLLIARLLIFPCSPLQVRRLQTSFNLLKLWDRCIASSLNRVHSIQSSHSNLQSLHFDVLCLFSLNLLISIGSWCPVLGRHLASFKCISLDAWNL